MFEHPTGGEVGINSEGIAAATSGGQTGGR